MHINTIQKTEGANFENPSETFAKLLEAIPQVIPMAKNRYPNNGFIIWKVQGIDFSLLKIIKLENIYYFII